MAEGSGFPFNNFSRQIDSLSSQITTNSIYCFSEDADKGEIFNVRMKVGLIRDHEVHFDSDLVVRSYNEVYFPDNHYMTSDPIP